MREPENTDRRKLSNKFKKISRAQGNEPVNQMAHKVPNVIKTGQQDRACNFRQPKIE